MLLLCFPAAAESPHVDFQAVIEFTDSTEAKNAVQGIIESALGNGDHYSKEIFELFKNKAYSIGEKVLAHSVGMLTPGIMLAVLRGILPQKADAATGAVFLLRINLMLAFASLTSATFVAAEGCLQTVKRFTDIIVPPVTALLVAMGMEGSAALVSPAAAFAGNAAHDLFLRYGLPLCRISLCTAIAGNLCEEIDLNRFTSMFRKTANWIAGLAVSIFTALLALQGSVSEGLDGVGMRTAKFAVDSVSPVIGSGVSDAWESYISGLMVSKNALGVSGIAALLITCAGPMLMCLFAMFVFTSLSAAMDVFGEKLASRAASQIAGVCQMALSLCTAAVSIATILLGAAMAAGKGLFS